MSTKKRILISACVIAFASGALSAALPDTRPAARSPQQTVYPSATLIGLGPQRVFEGEYLNEIAFPLGGIGTGTVSLGGRGNLRDWEIFNRPGKGVNLPFTFFALYFEQNGAKKVRVLEGPIPPPYTTGFGFRREFVPGLPRMEKARFKGAYPFAEVELSDSQIPLAVTLEGFNPMIPLEAEDSGIPAVILRFKVKNTGAAPARITIAGTLLNPIGYDGVGQIAGTGNDKFGQNVNEIKHTETLRGLAMSSRKVKPEAPAFGTITLATPWKDITYLTHWSRAEWFDDLQIFWDDLSADGRLKDLDEVSPSPDKQSDLGTLGLMATIGPGEEVTLPFILSWNFPNFLDYFDVVPEQRGKIYKNHYAETFGDSWAAAEYLQANLDRLEKASRTFRDAFFAATLPPYVLDAVSSQAAIIRTATGFRLAGGKYFGFEGCGDQEGCCPLNCAHVWNYEQSLAWLYPGLERTMRETDFLNNVKPDGAMVFRTSLPIGSGVYWNFRSAADGQLGRIISLYRDWHISGDTDWLKKLWPQAKKAMAYAWSEWDKDKDGLMEGEQHNTYDIEFFGPNSMLSGFYLGALKAAVEMAAAVADWPAAKAYRAVLDQGLKNYDAVLWNGEYYIQKYDKVMEKKYQYGEGCLSDQLLGQWLGMVAGVGRFLPQERVKSTLRAIYTNNFLPDFRNFSNAQRTYALGDEKGLLLCSWPKGGRPPLPFPYSDEVWTGIEYQVASHMIYEGLLEEGLSIVKAVRDRYDGRRRNPWNEVECGHHYARAMSSWGVLLALAGYYYSGPDMSMGFDPKVAADDFRTVWTADSGWGNYAQKADGAGGMSLSLSAEAGKVALREFSFMKVAALRGKKTGPVKATLGGKAVALVVLQGAAAGPDPNRVTVRFAVPVAVVPGAPLVFELK